MTYGTLKFRLTKAFPGVDPDLIEGWIGDRYSEILHVLPWHRLQVQSILQTTAPYRTGTVAVVQGSADITLTGGAFTPSMTGLGWRAGQRNEYYQLRALTSTTATLDRPYEGPTDPAGKYTVFQHVYPLPADARMLEDDAFGTFGLSPMRRLSGSELNAAQPFRTEYGSPTIWASYMSDNSTPPRLQIELFPIPDQTVGIPFRYVSEPDALTATSQIAQVWVEPSALLEGTTAKIKRHLKDYMGAKEHDDQAEKALRIMIGVEAQEMAPMRLQLDQFYTQHRMRRVNR